MLQPRKLDSKNFLSSLDLSKDEILHILELAKNFKDDNLEIQCKNKVLGLIFDKINSDYQKSLGGLIIITDGQINQGPPLQEFYDGGSKVAVYTVGVGDTNPMLDIFIRSIDSPPLSIKGQNVNINVIISGLGNIYVNEILFFSRVRPTKKIKKLKNFEIQKIIKFSKKIISKAIKLGGSSIKDFSSISGKKGSFQQHFSVYGKKGENCKKKICKGIIIKIVISNRSTFYCAKCQK